MRRPVIGDKVTLSHGGGGTAMRDLIEDVFASAFGSDSTEDQARIQLDMETPSGARLAYTTDGFVVSPLEFPGGNIGKLAVCGTVNDLAVGGAIPRWISAAFIIEEGCDIELLRRIAATMAQEAKTAGVAIVTGDTKVVDRGAADGVFITTSGVGLIPEARNLSATNLRLGDVALVNGPLGDHGTAVLAARGDLALGTSIVSDCQSLNGLMEVVLDAAPDTRCARDATRGGLASALNELAGAAEVSVEIEETALPLRTEVKGLCEILGLDPLYLANEGTLVVFVPPEQAEAALTAMHHSPSGRDACIIGHVVNGAPGRVTMRTPFGGTRIVDMLVGDQLPRIC